MSARDLGLPGDVPAGKLARAAIERKARALGVRDARRLRLARRVSVGRLRQLRFQQTAGGVRVLWSQLDVTIVGGKVSTIGATVVPVRGGTPVGGRRVGRERALAIARAAVPGPEEAVRPRAVVYAGNPTTAHCGPGMK